MLDTRRAVTRACNAYDRDGFCDAPGAWHLLMFSGRLWSICDDHFNAVVRTHVRVIRQMHDMKSDCGMPGVSWSIPHNACVLTPDKV